MKKYDKLELVLVLAFTWRTRIVNMRFFLRKQYERFCSLVRVQSFFWVGQMLLKTLRYPGGGVDLV